MNLPKPIIEDIPKDKQEAAQKILGTKSTRLTKHTKLNDLTGFCCICGKIAQKILKEDVTDADDGDHKIFRVQRYCDSCYQRWVVEIEKNSEI